MLMKESNLVIKELERLIIRIDSKIRETKMRRTVVIEVVK